MAKYPSGITFLRTCRRPPFFRNSYSINVRFHPERAFIYPFFQGDSRKLAHGFFHMQAEIHDGQIMPQLRPERLPNPMDAPSLAVSFPISASGFHSCWLA